MSGVQSLPVSLISHIVTSLVCREFSGFIPGVRPLLVPFILHLVLADCLKLRLSSFVWPSQTDAAQEAEATAQKIRDRPTFVGGPPNKSKVRTILNKKDAVCPRWRAFK